MKEEKGTAAVLPEETAMATTDRTDSLILKRILSPEQSLAYQAELTELITTALKRGTDYGRVPGTKKDSLFQAGAERVSIAFACQAEFEILDKEVDHDRPVHWTKQRKIGWDEQAKRPIFEIEEGDSVGLYRYVVRCKLINRATGAVVGDAIGSASSMESKYVDRPRDCENTILQMAEKRSFVRVNRNVFGLSDRFTQDMEDQYRGNSNPEPEKKPQRKPTPAVPSIGQLFTKARAAGVDDDTWRAWCKYTRVTKDPATQTPDNMTELDAQISDFIKIGRGEIPGDDKPDDKAVTKPKPKAKRGKNRAVTAEQVIELSDAGGAAGLFSTETGLLLYVNELLKTELRSADALTVGEYEQVLKEIGRSGPPAKDAGRDLPTAVAQLKETLDANDLIAGENGFVGAVNFLTRHVNQPEIADEEEITFELIGMVGDGLERWQAEQDSES